MKSLYRIELLKILKSRRFQIALLLACTISIAQAVLVVCNYIQDIKAIVEALDIQDMGISVASVYNYFIAIRNNYDVIAGLFIQSWPLFIALSCSWCFIDDIKSGMSEQLIVHANKKTYLVALYSSVVTIAASIILVAYFVNFMILSSWLPLSMPQISDILYIGVLRSMPLSSLFYTHPLLCIVLLSGQAALIASLWALLVMNISVLSRNFTVSFLVSYVVLLFINTIGDQLRILLLNSANAELAKSALIQLDIFTAIAAVSRPNQGLFLIGVIAVMLIAIAITTYFILRRGVTRSA